LNVILFQEKQICDYLISPNSSPRNHSQQHIFYSYSNLGIQKTVSCCWQLKLLLEWSSPVVYLLQWACRLSA